MSEKVYVAAVGRGRQITVEEDSREVLRQAYLYSAVVSLAMVDSLVYGHLAQRFADWCGGA